MKRLTNSILLIVFLLNFNSVFAWTWGPVQPYKIYFPHGISVKAVPYTPYYGPILLEMGLTQVYKNGRLLYNISSYFDEEIVVSKNGDFFAVVRTYQPGDIIHQEFLDGSSAQIIDLGMPVVWLFRLGELVKIYTLNDVVDELALRKKGEFRNWGYEFDYNTDYRLKQEFGRLYKKSIRYNEVVDSLKYLSEEKNIYANRVYVEKDVLYIYTKLKTLVSIQFSDFGLTIWDVDSEIIRGDILKRRMIRKEYEPINFPDEFTSLRLANKTPLDSALAAFLNLRISQSRDESSKKVSVGLLIDTNGSCRKTNVHVYDKSESYILLPIPEVEERIKQWITKQNFDAGDIPKGFDAYLFSNTYNFY